MATTDKPTQPATRPRDYRRVNLGCLLCEVALPSTAQ